MPRPHRLDEQRKRLLPVVAKAFSDLGYRRATTAQLARRCRVRENILYRLWKDKKAMFIAALHSLFEQRREELERAIAASSTGGTRAERMISHVAKHYGDDSLARVIFAALAETDDREIRRTLMRMYRNYQAFVENEIGMHRSRTGGSFGPGIDLSAVAIIGLATALNVYSEIGLIPGRARKRFYARAFTGIAPLLLGGGKR